MFPSSKLDSMATSSCKGFWESEHLAKHPGSLPGPSPGPAMWSSQEKCEPTSKRDPGESSFWMSNKQHLLPLPKIAGAHGHWEDTARIWETEVVAPLWGGEKPGSALGTSWGGACSLPCRKTHVFHCYIFIVHVVKPIHLTDEENRYLKRGCVQGLILS